MLPPGLVLGFLELDQQEEAGGGPRSDSGVARGPEGTSEIETLRRIWGTPGAGEATGALASTARAERQGQQPLQSEAVLFKEDLGGAGPWW